MQGLGYVYHACGFVSLESETSRSWIKILSEESALNPKFLALNLKSLAPYPKP